MSGSGCRAWQINRGRARYGKITVRMNTNPETLTVTPPRLIPAFAAGFNTVANHVHLILPPLLLDLLLWLGPRLSIKNLVQPRIESALNGLSALSAPEMNDMINQARQTYETILSGYNLMDVLSTFPPVGIPGLFVRRAVESNPLGAVQPLQISSDLQAFLFWAVLTLAGFFLGSLYYSQVARTVNGNPSPLEWNLVLRQTGQSILLALLLLLLGMLLMVPVTIALTLFLAITPGLAQFIFLLVLLLAFWLIMPLLFSPHGIFANQQTAVTSTLVSIRLVRFFMPGTGTFYILVAVLSLGLNLLWLSPPTSSWMALIGLAGHAFISTALLAASFCYYRDGMRWMQYNLQKIAAAPNVA